MTNVNALRATVAVWSEPRARMANTIAAATRPRPGGELDSLAQPHVSQGGPARPNSANAATSAVATMAPRRQSRNSRAHTPSTAAAPATARTSGPVGPPRSMGSTSARLPA